MLGNSRSNSSFPEIFVEFDASSKGLEILLDEQGHQIEHYILLM